MHQPVGIVTHASLPGARPRVRRRGRALGMSSGVLLFVAMFLPAFSACGTPVLPLALPPLWPMYMLGALAALAFADRASALGVQVCAFLVFLPVVVGSAVGVTDPAKLDTAGPALAASLMGLALLVPVLRRSAPPARRFGRAIWVPALASTVLFGVMHADPEVMFGTGVAFVGALGLTIAGILAEVE